jgi:hypothetical protein
VCKGKELFQKFLKFQLPEYTTMAPFFILNITKNIKKNMYIGVKKKLTNQQPRTK